ncbi:MAG: hypothetical protein JSS50_01150 [Proteobacteria bacterium]|nr:hypothetical protein [Pseudomonadota bacterium]
MLQTHLPSCIGIFLGAGTVATGAGLAIAGHEAALIPVVNSNLSMVLTIGGASLMALMTAVWFPQMGAYDMEFGNKRKEFESRAKPPLFSNVIVLLGIASGITGIYYGGFHYALGDALSYTTLNASESLLAQAGIAWAASTAFFMLLISYMRADDLMQERNRPAQNQTSNTSSSQTTKIEVVTAGAVFKEEWGSILFMSSMASLVAAAITTVGPAFSLYMGSAATTATGAAYMEALISLSAPWAVIAPFFALAHCATAK